MSAYPDISNATHDRATEAIEGLKHGRTHTKGGEIRCSSVKRIAARDWLNTH